MSKNSNPMKVVTGVNTRWSYVNAWEAKSINGGKSLSYGHSSQLCTAAAMQPTRQLTR